MAMGQQIEMNQVRPGLDDVELSPGLARDELLVCEGACNPGFGELAARYAEAVEFGTRREGRQVQQEIVRLRRTRHVEGADGWRCDECGVRKAGAL